MAAVVVHLSYSQHAEDGPGRSLQVWGHAGLYSDSQMWRNT